MFTVNYDREIDRDGKIEREECHVINIPDWDILRSVVSNLTSRYDVGSIEITETDIEGV